MHIVAGDADAAKTLKKNEVCEVAKLREEVDSLKKMKFAAIQPAMATVNATDTSVRLQHEFDEAKRRAQDANERWIAALEEQVQTLKHITEEAVSEAEGWKLEAQSPGNKRGGIAIGVTPSPQIRTRPRCAPVPTPVNTKKKQVEDYSELVARHF
ncbi:hypothetical protein CBR_g50393 [Chara braunii]|uniref:Uncharacterized protein n=1 Tax=Chara braunii TaxID=69332 RepID=A0A388M6J8_CHABU|nr:hypothetical protein CBR_g50393 [Chara braunii]|eukprot:GBG90214.1 hypothetical protein CBR_g50393 [Chara braunii]